MGSIKIIKNIIEALVEDWPGRLGYYKNGFPISGPSDPYAHRVGNILVGNDPTNALIEVSGGMFAAEFNDDAIISVTGGDLSPEIDGIAIPMWRAITIKKSQVLSLKSDKGLGFKSYIAISGGILVPKFLGSSSTCIYGNYGGFEGRSLKVDDVLIFGESGNSSDRILDFRLPEKYLREYSNNMEVKIMLGPSSYPEYINDYAIDTLSKMKFKVSRNSNRSGSRLESDPSVFPKGWARKDGGEAGIHPSNIVDMGYTVPGGLNIAGDQIIVLGPDGPCGGGYVIIGSVISSSLSNMFQLTPGKGQVRFKIVEQNDVENLRISYEREIQKISSLISEGDFN